MIALLAVAGAVLSAGGNILIWRDTWRWKASGVRPVAASWLEWAALTATGAAAAAAAGQVPAAALAAACALGCAVVVLLAARIPAAERDDPVRVFARLTPAGRGTRLDMLLLPGVLAGFMLLLTPLLPAGHGWVRSPAPAAAAAVAVDLLAYLPVIGHAWRHPAAEPWPVYGLFGGAAAASLAAVAVQGRLLNLTAVAYPAYLAAADLGVAVMIAVRVPATRPCLSRCRS